MIVHLLISPFISLIVPNSLEEQNQESERTNTKIYGERDSETDVIYGYYFFT